MDALEFIFTEECWLNDEALVLILNMILIFGLEIPIAPNDFVSVSLNHVVDREKRCCESDYP